MAAYDNDCRNDFVLNGARIARVLLFVATGLLSSLVGAQGIEEILAPTEEAPAAADAGSIALESDAASDEGIRARLSGIFGELETLEDIGISVDNGVVTLDGTAPTVRAEKRAKDLARQVEGVVDVVDGIEVDTHLGRRVSSTYARLQESLLSLVASLPMLLLALLLIGVFWILGRLVGKGRRIFRAVAPNAFIAELLATVARIVVTMLGVIVALTLLDATSIIGSVLGAAGIVGLAVGFAVRDTVENFIASILLSLRTPFVTHDYVRIGEHEGTVARLTSRATILISHDGNHLRVPNALVYKSVIVNFTRQPERRFEFVIGIDTDLDLTAAQQIALDTIYDVPGVLPDPPASALVTELGDSNVAMTLRAWMDQRSSDCEKVRSEAIRQVKQAFDEAGIVMPEPVYRVRIKDPGTGIGIESVERVELGGTDRGDAGAAFPSESGAGASDKSATRRDKMPGMAQGTAPGTAQGKAVRKVSGKGGVSVAEASDISADASARRNVDRELAGEGTENLLADGAKCE